MEAGRIAPSCVLPVFPSAAKGGKAHGESRHAAQMDSGANHRRSSCTGNYILVADHVDAVAAGSRGRFDAAVPAAVQSTGKAAAQRRGGAIALLTLLGAVLGMLWGLIPPLLRQSAQLMSRLPALLDSLRELLTRWSAALEARGIPLGDMQAELFSRISAAAGQLAATLVSGIRRLTGSVSQWLLAPLLSFYFLRDRKRFCLLLSLVLPVKYRARGIRAAREMRRESALYLRGQLILSLFVAAMTALALLLTRTPGALLLGLFMGVMELIPYIGPFIAGVPAVLLALQSGWTAALWTLLAICLVQQVEANLLSPRLLSGATRLHPLAVLLAIAFGGMAGGVVGMMAALPLVVCVRGAVRGWRE